MNDSIENYVGSFVDYGSYFAKINKVESKTLVNVTLFNAIGTKICPKYKKVTDFHVIPIKSIKRLTAQEHVDNLKN